MPRRREPGQPRPDDHDIGRGGGAPSDLFDGRGEAKIDVAVGEEEGVGGGDEAAVFGPDRLHGVVLGEPRGDVGAPPGEDVVADDDVIGLVGAAGGGDDVGLDLLLDEGVDGEADRDGDEGLDVELLGEAAPAAGPGRGGAVVDLEADELVHQLLVVDARPVLRRPEHPRRRLRWDHLGELLLLPPPPLPGRCSGTLVVCGCGRRGAVGGLGAERGGAGVPAGFRRGLGRHRGYVGGGWLRFAVGGGGGGGGGGNVRRAGFHRRRRWEGG